MKAFRALLLTVAFVAAALPHGAQASPEPAGHSGDSPALGRAQGAIVVAASATCRDAAKALARQIYADHRLRPTIDEATARALVGDGPTGSAAGGPPAEDEPASSAADGPPAEDGPETTEAEKASAEPTDRLAEIREVVTSIGTACRPSCDRSSVARRLITSLGRELGARLVVVVSCSPSDSEAVSKPAPAVAQVVQVPEARFVPMVLAAKVRSEGPSQYQWDDAARVLGSLVAAPSEPPPTGTTAPRRSRKPSATASVHVNANGNDDGADEDDDDLAFLSSPWFWGGLGAVVAIGVTVFAISQTSLNEPDVIRVQGHVSP